MELLEKLVFFGIVFLHGVWLGAVAYTLHRIARERNKPKKKRK